jgi:hypothetical protein
VLERVVGEKFDGGVCRSGSVFMPVVKDVLCIS